MPDGQPRETDRDGARRLPRAVAADWRITHARGAEIERSCPTRPARPTPTASPGRRSRRPRRPTGHLIAEAAPPRARPTTRSWWSATRSTLTGESKSTATLELQGGQIALLDALAATEAPMIVVLVNSKPPCCRRRRWTRPAIIRRSTRACAAARAIAELVLGLIEPSGRLPLSVPRHVGQQPVYYNQIRGSARQPRTRT
jgi:beta-glucosidase